MRPSNQLRIIGGKWRARKITFPKVNTLRPTGDRIRETLFNWLAGVIIDAICLDLFAGSGVLGFEALSRGAKKVVFVDYSTKVAQQLRKTSALLHCQDRVEVYRCRAKTFLKQNPLPVNIVFLDPPFESQLLPATCHHLVAYQVLKPHSYIYMETKGVLNYQALPQNWTLIKHLQAGQVNVNLMLTL